MNITIMQFADTVSNGRVDTSGIGALGALVVFLVFASIFAFAIAVFVFWVMALIHLIQNEDVKDRTLWLVLLFVVGGIIGPVYHFAVRKPYESQKSKTTKKSKR